MATAETRGPVRLSGVNIPGHQHVQIGLTRIYGVGRQRALDICQSAGIKPESKMNQMSDEELEQVRTLLTQLTLEGDLRIKIKQCIQRLKNIRCYRGSRHQRGLPGRGQRTKTNARTRKGRKKLVVGKEKKA